MFRLHGFSWVDGKRRDGKTEESAVSLDEFHLPKFMKVGGTYQVVTGPVFLRSETIWLFCKMYQYRIRSIGGDGQVFFIESPVILPRQFLVVKFWKIRLYEYRPINGEKKIAERDLVSFPSRHFAPA